MTGFPFPLDDAELRRLKAIADRTVDECLTEEFEPGHLEIDRARERRNPEYFNGTYHELHRVAVRAWGLGEVDAARESLQLMPEMLGEALTFGWRPVASEAQVAISFSVILGYRSLVRALVAADRGQGFPGAATEEEKLNNPITWWNRCVADLLLGNDESVRSSVEAVAESIEALDLPGDRELLTAQAAMLLAIVDNNSTAFDAAVRHQNDRVCGVLASLAKPEHSEELIDVPATAMLAIALRRGMNIPRDLPVCPVHLIVSDWVD